MSSSTTVGPRYTTTSTGVRFAEGEDITVQLGILAVRDL
jgi:hypothetical protein